MALNRAFAYIGPHRHVQGDEIDMIDVTLRLESFHVIFDFIIDLFMYVHISQI